MENPEIELLLLLAVSLSPNSIKDIASASGIKANTIYKWKTTSANLSPNGSFDNKEKKTLNPIDLQGVERSLFVVPNQTNSLDGSVICNPFLIVSATSHSSRCSGSSLSSERFTFLSSTKNQPSRTSLNRSSNAALGSPVP